MDPDPLTSTLDPRMHLTVIKRFKYRGQDGAGNEGGGGGKTIFYKQEPETVSFENPFSDDVSGSLRLFRAVNIKRH